MNQNAGNQPSDDTQKSQFFKDGTNHMNKHAEAHQPEKTKSPLGEAKSASLIETATHFLEENPQLKFVSTYLKANWKTLLSEVVVASVSAALIFRANQKKSSKANFRKSKSSKA